MRRHPPTTTALLTAATLLALPPLLPAASSSATPSSTPAGVTPRFLGFNTGHYRTTGNTSAWTDYSGANAARVWVAASQYTSATEGPTYGDGVTTQAQFDADRAAFRANPTSSPFLPAINWSKTQTGNNINLDYVLSQMQQKGIDVVIQSTRSTNYNYVGSGTGGNIWGGRWEQWKWYYALAYFAASNYDVQRYEMYNEPDHSSSGINTDIAQWVDRLQVASDAVRAAIADVNANLGKSLTAEIFAPVSAGSPASTVDTWGKAALNANRTGFAGNALPYNNFDVYDVHRYNSTGPSFASDQQLLDSKVPAYNATAGQNLPVAYTEFNRFNSGTFSSSTVTLDTPSVYTELAAILPGAMSENVKAMYAFKFNQTYWTSSSTGRVEPQPTGFYYVDDSGSAPASDPHNTTGATQGAEVMRLANKAFKGERPRYAIATGNSLNDAAGSFDADAQRYYYYSVNRDTAAASVTLNLSNWNVSPGQLITVEEVSPTQHGSVSRTFTLPANKTLTFSQTAQSLYLLSIPSGAAQTSVDLPAIADASVSNANPTTNNGAATTAFAARDAAGTNDDATYLKFSLASTSKPTISRAILWLTGQNITNSTLTPLHLYGLLTDSWTETGINWSNAPDLAGATDAKLANVNTDAFPLGQLTYDATTSQYGVDVTTFVRTHPDSLLTFALLREQRFAGDADTSRIQLNTRESPTGQPRLSLSLYANPVYNWHLNANGPLSTPSNLDVQSSPNAPGSVLNLGAFITSPHTVSVTTPTTLGALNFNNLNTYTLAGPSSLTLDNGASSPAINVYQGSHKITAPLAFAAPAALSIAPGTSLDITTNALTLSPTTPIRQYLLSRQLFSSSSDPTHTLGYLFSGEPAAPTSLLVKLTLVGDANLDGKLDADDFALLDRGFARHLTTWSDGDFNYDGQITPADYLLIDTTYGQAQGFSPGFLSQRESQFGADYISQLLTSIPEPTSLFAACGLAVFLPPRRHRPHSR